MDSIKIKFHVVQGGFEMIFQGIETIEDEVVERLLPQFIP